MEREQKLRHPLNRIQKRVVGTEISKRQKGTHAIRMRKRGEMEKGRKKN